MMTKRIVAVSLVLILVLSLCATAFADYYPTVKFTSGCKNKYVQYGKRFNLKVKCKQGSGPFSRVLNCRGGWIERAGMTVDATGSGFSKRIADYNFWGNTTVKHKVSTYTFNDPIWGIDTYTLIATSWYKPTVGRVVFGFRKYKSVKTNLYIYR